MDLTPIILGTFGVVNTALLAGIFLRLGRGQARFEELFRRIAAVETSLAEMIGRIIKGESKT